MDVRFNPESSNIGSTSPTATRSQLGSTLPTPPSKPENLRPTRCVTGFRFLTTIHGILNLITIVALVCVLISAGVADNGKDADNSDIGSKAKVSAFHTRNAVIVFAVIGLLFMLLDTIAYVTGIIRRIPLAFDISFIIIMLGLGVIYLILGCCAAAWEQKMRDTLGPTDSIVRKGAAASAAFFLFVTMIAVFINFFLRLFGRPAPSFTPSSVINRNAYDIHMDAGGSSKF